jgi:hypothetical protein
MKPWRQSRPHWDFAAELLLRAAQAREEDDMEAATAQMVRAFQVEGDGMSTYTFLHPPLP